jgi:5'-methylthioadenosine/S-adenosylhomocysteine nucleosidase
VGIRPVRILWVDDDGANRFDFELHLLSERGDQVEFATNVLDASRLLASHTYDALILDNVMQYAPSGREPVGYWGGIVLLYWVRRLPRPFKAPSTYSLHELDGREPARANSRANIIFVTAYHDDEMTSVIQKAARPAELIPVLHKPLDHEALLEALDKAKRKSNRRLAPTHRENLTRISRQAVCAQCQMHLRVGEAEFLVQGSDSLEVERAFKSGMKQFSATVHCPGCGAPNSVSIRRRESPMPHKVDVAIVTALREELDAVLSKASKTRTVSGAQPSARTYHLVTTEGGTEIVVALSLGMGQLNAAALTTDLLAEFQPRFVILVGIAGGLGDAVKLGDVVVSDQVVDYEIQKVRDDGRDLRWSVYRSAPELLASVQNTFSETWKSRITVSRPDGLPSSATNTVIGTVLSGNKMIASTKEASSLRSVWSRSSAVEMEAAGIAAVLYQRTASVGFLMVKGICDLADAAKVDSWHAYAADAAATFVWSLLSRITGLPVGQAEPELGAIPASSGNVDGRGLRFALGKAYDLEELKVLAFDLGVDWDEIAGERKSVKIVGLIQYLNKRQSLHRLIQAVNAERDGLLMAYSAKPWSPDLSNKIGDTTRAFGGAAREHPESSGPKPPERSAGPSTSDPESTKDLEHFFRDLPLGDTLRRGASGIAVRNIQTALNWLGYRRAWNGLNYDDQLAECVRQFQIDNDHRNKDGCVGPGTRRLLVEKLLAIHFDFGQMTSVFEYDVALSFAGEDRAHAEALANDLKKRGIRVFYDEYEQATIWGKDLYVHLHDVYNRRAQYCVIFASKRYAEKLWTSHERQAAQERAFEEKGREYILPVRIDSTPIPGLPKTIGYLRIEDGILRIGEFLAQKLRAR